MSSRGGGTREERKSLLKSQGNISSSDNEEQPQQQKKTEKEEQKTDEEKEEEEEVYEPQADPSQSPGMTTAKPPKSANSRSSTSVPTSSFSRSSSATANKRSKSPSSSRPSSKHKHSKLKSSASKLSPKTTTTEQQVSPPAPATVTSPLLQLPDVTRHSHENENDHHHHSKDNNRPRSKSIQSTSNSNTATITEEMEEHPTKKNWIRNAWEEMKAILWLAVPISTSFFLDNAMGTITLLFMGHMGARELAAGSLGLTLTNTTGWSVGNGLLMALDTQAAHVWGAGKRKRLGVITQRATYVIILYCIPISVVWLFADKILVLLKQDPEISQMTRTFVMWMIPGLFPAMIYEAIRRHLQAMNVVVPITAIVLISIPLETCYLWLCLQVFELGLAGCAIAVSMIYITQLALLLAYVLGRRHVLGVSWPGFTRKAFHGWGRFLKLAIPSALMSCMEGWGFDIMSFFAGWIGTVQLASHSALINTYYIAYMIPLGVGCAATTRVGTLLGSRKPGKARLSYYISLVLCVFFELIMSLILVSGRTFIAKLFCTDVSVVAMYVQLIPIVCLVMLVDGAQLSGSGALRGLGKQRFGMICNFIAFYIVGLPLGYVLTFVLKLGMIGIWFGIGACDSISAICFTIVLLCSNWRKAAVEIAEEAEAAKIAAKEHNIQGDDPTIAINQPSEHTTLTPEVDSSNTPTPTYGAIISSPTPGDGNERNGTFVVDVEAEERKMVQNAEIVEGEEDVPTEGPLLPDTIHRRAVESSSNSSSNEDDNDDESDKKEEKQEEKANQKANEKQTSTAKANGGDTESDDSAVKASKERKKSVIRIQEPPSPKLDPDM